MYWNHSLVESLAHITTRGGHQIDWVLRKNYLGLIAWNNNFNLFQNDYESWNHITVLCMAYDLIIIKWTFPSWHMFLFCPYWDFPNLFFFTTQKFHSNLVNWIVLCTLLSLPTVSWNICGYFHVAHYTCSCSASPSQLMSYTSVLRTML